MDTTWLGVFLRWISKARVFKPRHISAVRHNVQRMVKAALTSRISIALRDCRQLRRRRLTGEQIAKYQETVSSEDHCRLSQLLVPSSAWTDRVDASSSLDAPRGGILNPRLGVKMGVKRSGTSCVPSVWPRV